MLGTEVLLGTGKEVNISSLEKGTYILLIDGQAIPIVKD
jgi:hypothetical protein